MAEAGTIRQADLNDTLVNAEIRANRATRWMAYTLAVGALVAGVALIIVGQITGAALVLSLPVALMVRAMFRDFRNTEE